MLNDQNIIPTTTDEANNNIENEENDSFRDIHALITPSPPNPTPPQIRRREAWETGSSSSSENFTTMSREFNALVLAGNNSSSSSARTDGDTQGRSSVPDSTDQEVQHNHQLLLARIREDDIDYRPPGGEEEEEEEFRETNPLAIVADNSGSTLGGGGGVVVGVGGEAAGTVQRVKREEVEAKISAWQNAKVAKINNRFKREDAVIGGWENEQVHKATSWMKKIERKLEEKRARALEKMQNDVAKARRKAEERRASAEAKRGTKVAGVLEIANLMRAVGRPPVKRSFF